MAKRMVIMLVSVVLLFGGIYGYHAYQALRSRNLLAGMKPPPIAVSATKAVSQTWQPQLKAVGSLRALRGIEVTSEISGLVRTIHFRSGEDVKEGQLLLQLNADADLAQLRTLEAAVELAELVYERDKKQLAVQAVSKATFDTDTADLKGKRSQVEQQKALVDKKTIRAPFAGRLGISTVNPGQYVNPGDKIVTLQALDSLYADFYLPQQELTNLAQGRKVSLTTDGYPGRVFAGKVTAVNAKVEADTRNVLVEATVTNSEHLLLPGMYVGIEVQTGQAQRYLTLPQTVVTYNPYGDTVYVVRESSKTPDGKVALTARQTFVTVGRTRGDQVAILKGIKEGDVVVTSGQLKLKNGSVVAINNKVQPANEASPVPIDE